MSLTDTNKIDSPRASVIVVAFNSSDLLGRCLQALSSQPDSNVLDVLVVCKQPATCDQDLAQRFFKTRVLPVERSLTIPEMRLVGIRNAKADIVALIEDDCMVGPAWLSSMLDAHNAGHRVVGGPVEAGDYSCGRDWAVYFCEYGRFGTPFSGQVSFLSGTNVSYRAEDMVNVKVGTGFEEVFFHETIIEQGGSLFASADMLVTNQNKWKNRNCLSGAFHHGRAYAAKRFGSSLNGKRALYALFSLFLPVIKTLRTLKSLHSSKRREIPLLTSVLWIFVFQLSWSAGEFTGYLSGAGKSTEQWR